MEHSNLFYLGVLAVSFLLFLSAYVAVYSKKMRLPYTVALVLFGILLAALSRFEPLSFLNVLELSPNLVFYLFLPMLIFEGAYNIRFLELRSVLKTVSVLAVVTLLVSALFIGWALSLLFPFIGFEIPFLTLLLFGSLISATDPIAALAIFRELGVPKRLRLLLEGESIANDGTALVLFQVVLVLATAGGALTLAKVGQGIGQFWILVGGGIVFGVVMGVLFARLIEKIRNMAVVEITLTLVLAHATFIFAEKFFHVSGIIATAAAAIVIGNYGRYKISPEVRHFMEHFWEYAAFIANSLIFLLIGLSVRDVHFGEYILPVIVALFVVFIARFISIYAVIPFTNRFAKEEKVPWSWQFILSWGGLRGALPLAIVLLLPVDFPHRELLLVLTIAVIFFTLVLQAPTLTKFLHRFKLQALTPVQELEQEEGFLLIDSIIQKRLNEMHEKKYLSDSTFERLRSLYAGLQKSSQERLDAILKLRGEQLTNEEMLFILRKHLLGIERQAYIHLFDRHELSEPVLAVLKEKIDRQIDRIERHVPQTGMERAGMRLAFREWEQGLYQWLDRIPLHVIQRWSQIRKLHEAIDHFEKLRARKIATEKALRELEHIHETYPFLHSSVVEQVRSQYKQWQSHALEKMRTMEQENPLLVETIQYVLGNTVSIAMEAEILADLRDKGIISENVYATVREFQDRLAAKKQNIPERYFKEIEERRGISDKRS